MNLHGTYRATVIDNKDPKKQYRLKIKVTGLMDGIPDDYLPWALMESSTGIKAGGCAILPEIGAKVAVRFGEGDLNDPYWHGGIIEAPSDLPKNVKDKRYILYESPKKGITITVDENKEDIEIKTVKYNTTLGTLIDFFIAHGHQTSAGPTSTPVTLAPLKPIVAADFNTGDLK